MSFLEIVEDLMDMGMDGESACREAYERTHPETFDPEDYE